MTESYGRTQISNSIRKSYYVPIRYLYGVPGEIRTDLCLEVIGWQGSRCVLLKQNDVPADFEAGSGEKDCK